MAKNDTLVMTDRALFGIDSVELKRLIKKLKVVPYAKVDGERVTTCQIDEEALGLTEYVAGWNETGYYVRTDRKPHQAVRYMKTINWLRVVRVKAHFDIRAIGYMMVRDTPCWVITQKRYEILLKHCLLTYTEAQFEHEIKKAIDYCKRNGQRPTTTSGSLEESH